MKTILCYGDSNTFGYNPSNGMRYPRDIRWTGVLQELLGDDWHVIEEGCNGRTTVFDDPIDGWKNGRDYLKPCLNSHKPVDVVIMMLGSNDMKDVFHATAKESAKGASQLVDIIQTFTVEKQGFAPKVILVSPPEIGIDVVKGGFCNSFSKTAHERSKEFIKYFSAVAKEKGCILVDAAKVVRASEVDSLHLAPNEHRKLAEKFCEVVLGNV